MNIQKLTTAGFATCAFLLGAGSLGAADTDDRIEDAFENSYVYRSQLRDTDVEIDADDGVATLTGTVPNSDQKRLAEDTVRNLPGVTQVDNQIQVANEAKPASDDWIAMKVRGALLFHQNVSLSDTNVAVNQGVVTLSGTADTPAEKSLAGEYAADVEGVTKVENRIRVIETAQAASDKNDRNQRVAASDRDSMDRDATAKGTNTTGRSTGDKIDDASITAQLKYALGVRRSTSALNTEVSTQDGVVTVRGNAKNEAEKELVTQLAKDIEGVRDVRNEMTVPRS